MEGSHDLSEGPHKHPLQHNKFNIFARRQEKNSIVQPLFTDQPAGKRISLASVTINRPTGILCKSASTLRRTGTPLLRVISHQYNSELDFAGCRGIFLLNFAQPCFNGALIFHGPARTHNRYGDELRPKKLLKPADGLTRVHDQRRGVIICLVFHENGNAVIKLYGGITLATSNAGSESISGLPARLQMRIRAKTKTGATAYISIGIQRIRSGAKNYVVSQPGNADPKGPKTVGHKPPEEVQKMWARQLWDAMPREFCPIEFFTRWVNKRISNSSGRCNSHSTMIRSLPCLLSETEKPPPFGLCHSFQSIHIREKTDTVRMVSSGALRNWEFSFVAGEARTVQMLAFPASASSAVTEPSIYCRQICKLRVCKDAAFEKSSQSTPDCVPPLLKPESS